MTASMKSANTGNDHYELAGMRHHGILSPHRRAPLALAWFGVIVIRAAVIDNTKIGGTAGIELTASKAASVLDISQKISGKAVSTSFSRSTFFSSRLTCSVSDLMKNTNHGGASLRIVHRV